MLKNLNSEQKNILASIRQGMDFAADIAHACITVYLASDDKRFLRVYHQSMPKTQFLQQPELAPGREVRISEEPLIARCLQRNVPLEGKRELSLGQFAGVRVYPVQDRRGKCFAAVVFDLSGVDDIFINVAFEFLKTPARPEQDSEFYRRLAKYPGDNNEYANKYGASWVNVFFMLKALYENADSNQDEVFSNDGYAYYTCFVDENYYKGKSWTVYSNCAPRTILIANQLSVSTDRKSLYAKVRYSLSQRSITTFYHFGFNGYPYGTENITEEELSTAYYLNKNNLGEHKNPNAWNARNSAVQSNKEKSWYPDTNMIVPADGRQPMYQQAVRACMSRNRDLNGNGTIEANEVKWYMASVDQYRGLWYGEGALNSVDPDARLFRAKMSTLNDNDKENAKYHYFTASTGTNSIFWAEEGLSTSNKEVNTGWQHANLVRCVRTLASDDGLYEANKFYQYSDNIFTLTGLTATKGTTETIDIHLERDEINGLSSRIQVSKDYLKQKMVDGGWNNNYYTIKNKKRPEYDPCKYYYEDSGKTDKGIWRMPNQKELGLMSANNLLSGYVTCRTDYSGSKANGAYRSSYGFWFQGTNVTVHATDADLKVRCVKDVK